MNSLEEKSGAPTCTCLSQTGASTSPDSRNRLKCSWRAPANWKKGVGAQVRRQGQCLASSLENYPSVTLTRVFIIFCLDSLVSNMVGHSSTCCHACNVFHLMMQLSDQKVLRTSRVRDHCYSRSANRPFSTTAPKLSADCSALLV